jgi:hypothetical protein
MSSVTIKASGVALVESQLTLSLIVGMRDWNQLS